MLSGLGFGAFSFLRSLGSWVLLKASCFGGGVFLGGF